jgi:hypothetical protein
MDAVMWNSSAQLGNAPLTLAVALLIALAAGCATAGTGSGADRDVITAEMIAASSASDVHQLIRTTRPAWLRARGAVTMRTSDEGIEDVPIVVYLDNNRLGTVEDLSALSTQGITEIRRLSPRDATQRFGTGHSRGAIVVSRNP